MRASNEKIIIIDFGSPLNKVMTRKIRELNVYSELVSPTITAEEVKSMRPNGIIFGASPESVYTNRSPKPDPKIFDLNVPMLGVCYGLQVITQFYGGMVDDTKQNEFGIVEIEVDSRSKLFNGLPAYNTVHMSHGDRVKKAPAGFSVLAHSPGCPIAAISSEKEHIYGIQFHPEMEATKNGDDLLRNFLYDICQCTGQWTMKNYMDESVAEILETIRKEEVILPVNGDVKSIVLAALLHKAIADQLVVLFIDNGLLRKNEPGETTNVLAERFDINIITLDEKDSFFENLKEVEINEEKELAVQNQLINIVQREVSQMKTIKWYASSILYSDKDEKNNPFHQSSMLGLSMLKPLQSLHRQEVEELGRILRVPDNILDKQSLSFTGLAGKIKGKVNEERIQVLRESEAILKFEVFQAGLENQLEQFYTVLLHPEWDFKGEKWSYPILVKMIEKINSTRMMRAKIPDGVLDRIARRISNEVPKVSNVYYDITVDPAIDTQKAVSESPNL